MIATFAKFFDLLGTTQKIRLVPAAFELAFCLLPRPWRTKRGVKALSGPAKANAITEMLMREPEGGAYHPQG